MFLLDTMVVSELRKSKKDPNLANWYECTDSNSLFLSVITIGEIQKGICLLEKRSKQLNPSLQSWLQFIINNFGNRILPVTTEIAKEWGNISCKVGNSGSDNLIAATAIVHNLTVATRNIRHFDQTGVPCVNPWES